MHSLKLIAGLGNPGKKHERDRHNVGFWFLLRLAAARRVDLKPVAKYQGLVGKLARNSGELWLLMPQTYMNLSGQSVGALARFYKIQPEEILVVHDELDFPPGTAKLKLGGGVAGHNGLKDIAAQLGTNAFWRLRIGIGHPGDKDLVADYVLASPRASERELIETTLERCMEISGLLLDGDMEAAMLKLHTKS
ncbi:MAG TPA: aminoacyl-tRNA hydrolase [Burkholderiales bacterium]|nr:aminoacyl-tRNA hydrolase [Burkholderiales bacterium]